MTGRQSCHIILSQILVLSDQNCLNMSKVITSWQMRSKLVKWENKPKKTHKHEDINQKELVEWQRALMLASNKCCLVENLTGTTQAERRNGASPPGASTCLTSSSGTATPSTSTHCCQLQVVSCTCRADICHDRHYRQWCTLFKPMYFFLKRTQNLGPFCPILSQIYALFGVLFTGLNSMVGCQNWQTSGMCTCIGITVHPH